MNNLFRPILNPFNILFKSFQNTYLHHHIVSHDPFVSLDLGGVGTLMRATVNHIRDNEKEREMERGRDEEKTVRVSELLFVFVLFYHTFLQDVYLLCSSWIY